MQPGLSKQSPSPPLQTLPSAPGVHVSALALPFPPLSTSPLCRKRPRRPLLLASGPQFALIQDRAFRWLHGVFRPARRSPSLLSRSVPQSLRILPHYVSTSPPDLNSSVLPGEPAREICLAPAIGRPGIDRIERG